MSTAVISNVQPGGKSDEYLCPEQNVLAEQNAYQVHLFTWHLDHKNMRPVAQLFRPEELDRIMSREMSEGYLYGDGSIQVIFRKLVDRPFQLPNDTYTKELL